jgi:hypothetical protein
MKNRRSRLRLGDVVCDPRDPRHHAKVVHLSGGLGTTSNDAIRVKVKWLETSWTSEFDHCDLELVEARQESEMSSADGPRFNPDHRPKTLGTSPRAELERWLLKQRGE